jgi:hypothetical protein
LISTDRAQPLVLGLLGAIAKHVRGGKLVLLVG